MDSYEWNKIAGWVLAALTSVLGLSILTGYMFAPHPLEKPAYIVEGVEETSTAAGPAEVAKPIAAFLQTADIAKGEAAFKKCSACHTIDKGGAIGIGPNLYGIVGAQHAKVGGFGYSDGMMATAGKVWDWEGLSAWIENPKKYIPGNKMSFAGIGKPEERANLLAYLNSKSDSPLPVPAAPIAAAAADPAAGTDPAAAADAAAKTVPAPTA